MAAKVVMYATAWCPYCARARELLESKKVDYEVIDVDRDPALRQEMMARSNRHTVPQIFIGDVHVGGCDDLHALNAKGGLDPLLAG
ncbi:MAG: glutaredoxin 3 [Steroidobacteraceae bacterium]|jgi:glutaredoxin 3